MKECSEMVVTIKLKSYEFQTICEIINKADETDKENEDTLELNLNEKVFGSSIFKRLASSGKRKADKLEAIGAEVKNSIEFANYK